MGSGAFGIVWPTAIVYLMNLNKYGYEIKIEEELCESEFVKR
jgi:hypothetical protein